MSFNALKYVEELEQADLATKCDIRELALRITEQMTALELTLTKRVGLMIVSTATVLFGGLVAAMKFFSPQ